MKKVTKKKIKLKEPSLFKKLIDIYFEQCKRRKALRYLSKQAWSVDFLAVLLVKAARLGNAGVSLVITNRDGQSMTLRYDDDTINRSNRIDDSILNHLDDAAALDKFIALNRTW